DFKNIIYTEENDISWIKLNRPEKLNAFTKNMWEEFYETVELAKNSKTGVVVVSGIGRAFSAGDDIQAMYELKNKEEAENFFNTLLKIFGSLLEIEKPAIGMVNGLAYGGGFEILLLMDVVIATKESKFALSEAKLGLIPPAALSFGYTILGIKQINRLSLIGEAIDAYEAQRIGLVDCITEKDDLRNKTLEIAWKIISNATHSVQFIKKWSNIYKDKSKFIELISELTMFSLNTNAKKRMEDFVTKRKENEIVIFC
ncbi:enoyl-CoA hydratase/isomerase family protein, partial [Desulfurella sp.]|uniref:enoyl-CoA hydratase/isomerase family protein n=1 Tax=Desulfurella sp. TaxID=1962857 RepID=UPI003D0BC4A7